MAYQSGNRSQISLFPECIEDYISEDDPVRAYDAFVDSLDLCRLGIKVDARQKGSPQYNPRSMLKLFVYGYSYGIRSSRKLERALHHNVSFIWLLGGLKPDHKTIAEFRRKHKSSICAVLKQCVRVCLQLGLLEGNTLFVDGSKMRGSASINRSWDKKRCAKALKKVDARIESILSECERIDRDESDSSSLSRLQEDLKDAKTLKSKIGSIQKQIEESRGESVNTTDPDCVKIKGRQGSHAGYTGQIVTDEKNGLIVQSDVVSENNDRKQFARQIEGANETLGKPCVQACGDAGYAYTNELKKIDDQGIKVIVPPAMRSPGKVPEAFGKSRFLYDPEKDRYRCPAGKYLVYRRFRKDKNYRVYSVEKKADCLSCPHFGVCTTSKTGRRIQRLEHEEVKLKLETQYQTEESQTVYKLRKEKVEHPFGHIKRNLGAGAFLLRGLDGVRAEMALLTSCFNLARMITLLGVPKLVTALAK